MERSLIFASLFCCALLSAHAAEEATPDATPEMTASASPSTTESPAEQTKDEQSLVSLSAGAFIVKKPQEYSVAYSALELLDERAKTNWTSPRGVVTPQVMVVALPEKTALKTVEFDCGSVDYAGSCADNISVEMSDTSADQGFQKIADVSIKEGADKQRFPLSTEVPGRWVRLTMKDNHGSKEFIQLNDFRAYGTQLTQTPFPNVSGTYSSELGEVHLKQEGTSVTGCYETRAGVFEGGIEGRVVKMSWCDLCNTPKEARGPAVLVFSPDGQRFVGLYWDEGNTSKHGGHWEGTRKTSAVGTCPQWAKDPSGTGAAQGQMTRDLEQSGRVRVYGINFDSDSDRIKDESKPTLDQVAAMLKAKADWKMTIEGHTDSTSTPQHNQDLSERRAASVKNYLQAAGIEAARLTTIGYGQTKPVAENETELGRAQNRRVELVKQ